MKVAEGVVKKKGGGDRAVEMEAGEGEVGGGDRGEHEGF